MTKARTSARGYGPEHRALRARWSRVVAAGDAVCWRCGIHIAPHERWDLGHSDTDRSKYMGPEHSGCNRATAGRRTADPEFRTNSEW